MIDLEQGLRGISSHLLNEGTVVSGGPKAQRHMGMSCRAKTFLLTLRCLSQEGSSGWKENGNKTYYTLFAETKGESTSGLRKKEVRCMAHICHPIYLRSGERKLTVRGQSGKNLSESLLQRTSFVAWFMPIIPAR
jgi:hypothetical protein